MLQERVVPTARRRPGFRRSTAAADRAPGRGVAVLPGLTIPLDELFDA